MTDSTKICLKIIILIGILLSSLLSFSQVETNVNATGKHKKVVDNAKEVKQTAQTRKEQAKRLKEQIEAKKEYQDQYDSIKTARLDTTQLEGLVPPIFTKEDSLALANEILSQSGMEEYRELLEETIVIRPKLEDADSLALVKAKAVLEEHAQSFLPEELDQQKNPMAGLFDDPLNGSIPEKPSKPNPNLIAPEQAQKLLSQIDNQQFQEIQQKITRLKKVYEEVSDSRFPKEGKKRNSLEDLPPKKRVHLSGNVNIASTDPLILSSNIQLGYWINAKWLSGAGIIVRKQFTSADTLQSATGDSHGFNLFTQYDIKKGFFGRVQFESQVSTSLDGTENGNKKIRQNAMLVGIGKNFRLGIVQMNSTISYDLNFKNNTLNQSPIVMTMGVQFTKRPN